jgi:hypothetical protein
MKPRSTTPEIEKSENFVLDIAGANKYPLGEYIHLKLAILLG